MRVGFTLGLVALALNVSTAAAQELGWPDAVARLAAERTRAEACARVIKRFGQPAQVAVGELVYADGKSEIDAVVAGLAVALARGDNQPALADLEARLARGVDKRQTLCRSAVELLPPQQASKSIFGSVSEILTVAIGPLRDAVSAIWNARREDDALLRATIRTQLEATRWPEFGAVATGP